MDEKITTRDPPSAAALRSKRYRDRRKDGTRCIRIRFSDHAIAALVEAGFLPRDRRQDADIERAVYALLNAARGAGVTAQPA